MLNIALTGNVAAGKSTVTGLLREWGATIIDADALVREVQQPGTPVFAAMVARFGGGILAADGSLDRAALRTLVVADAEERRALEAIVHPAVASARHRRVDEARAAGADIVINDIPLLFEVLDPAAFDGVILVDAPAEMRRARLVRDRGLTAAEADRLMTTQQPAATKRPQSDFIIENDGTPEALRNRTHAVWETLRRRAGIA